MTGEAYTYSGKQHPTSAYPPHVLAIVPTLLASLQPFIKENIYTKLSHGIDILYSENDLKGGSNGAHSDDEMHWGLVIILSFGQTRWLRVRKKGKGNTFINVEMSDNSVCIMHGDTFQTVYQHQVETSLIIVYLRLISLKWEKKYIQGFL